MAVAILRDRRPEIIALVGGALLIFGCSLEEHQGFARARGEVRRLPLHPTTAVIGAETTFYGAFNGHTSTWVIEVAGEAPIEIIGHVDAEDALTEGEPLARAIALTLGWAIPRVAATAASFGLGELPAVLVNG